MTTAFDVLDALEGFATLERRSPLLDGAVPLRVAQGCVPLLEGNAFGFQVVLPRGVRARRGLRGVSLELDGELRARLSAAHAGAIPRLVAQGFLPETGAWTKRLRAGFHWTERRTLRLWTGLLVRPRAGVWLRVSDAANRRNRLLAVAERFYADPGDLVPLVLDISLRAPAASLAGEVACLAPLAPDTRVEVVPLARARALGEAHARFYDPAYFATKRGDVTKKYRKMVARERAPLAPGAGAVRVATVGPSDLRVERVERVIGLTATEPVAGPGAPALEHVVHGNAVGFEARYDGHNLDVLPDARALARGAEAVERRWREVFGEGSVVRDRRALWYLTKYFTPHTPGEPHFFVKPWAFTETPAGWSSLVEGLGGEGYDVLRGVVSTDVFHATPAVFALHGTGTIAVAAGEPLVKVFAVPRRLLAAGFARVRWKDEA